MARKRAATAPYVQPYRYPSPDVAGQARNSDRDFLERLARSDRRLEHDGETCGVCHYLQLEAQVAREMLATGESEDVVGKWSEETRRRWERSKFVKLWRRETKAGRDPRAAFRVRGWEA